MSSRDEDRRLRAADDQGRHAESHEPVPGPFVPGSFGAPEPEEWLTPQAVRPIPLRPDVTPERAAS